MNPAQLIRAAGQLAKLCGLEAHHREACDHEERATLDDVLELVDECAAAIDRSRPAPPPGEIREPRRPRHADRVLDLVGQGLHDPQIATQLGLSQDTVRGIRRRAGIAGAPNHRARSGWEEVIREAHGRGLLTPEIAEATGYTVRTVQQYLAELGLRANRLPKAR